MALDYAASTQHPAIKMYGAGLHPSAIARVREVRQRTVYGGIPKKAQPAARGASVLPRARVAARPPPPAQGISFDAVWLGTAGGEEDGRQWAAYEVGRRDAQTCRLPDARKYRRDGGTPHINTY